MWIKLDKFNLIKSIIVEKKIQNTSNNDNDDGDGNDDNRGEMERGVSLVIKRKKYVSTLEGDTSRKKQKSRNIAVQANKDEQFLNECAKLWTDGNMKVVRRETIPCVNPEN